jgi:choline-glycine betaine transporter
MLSLGATGVYLALMKSQMTNVFGGVLTFYLAATSWMTVRCRDGKPGMFDWIALLAALTVGAVIVTYGFQERIARAG